MDVVETEILGHLIYCEVTSMNELVYYIPKTDSWSSSKAHGEKGTCLFGGCVARKYVAFSCLE